MTSRVSQLRRVRCDRKPSCGFSPQQKTCTCASTAGAGRGIIQRKTRRGLRHRKIFQSSHGGAEPGGNSEKTEMLLTEMSPLDDQFSVNSFSVLFLRVFGVPWANGVQGERRREISRLPGPRSPGLHVPGTVSRRNKTERVTVGDCREERL